MYGFVMKWLFCVNDSLLDEIRAEGQVRDEIRECMTRRQVGSGVDAVKTAISEIRTESGYSLTEEPSTTFIVPGFDGGIEYIEKVVYMTDEPAPQLDNTALVIPKFAASVTLCLRSKFGRLSCNEANRMLIEREYLRICREGKVRNVDVVMHQQFVMNAYFKEGVNDRLALVRTRVPAWLRLVFTPYGENAEPTVC